MTNTIGEALGRRRNNFDAIRLVAAICVLLSHSYPMTGNPNEAFASFTGISGGELGVNSFFVISGFLVTASLQKRPLNFYVMSRLLRILPALFIAIFASVVVIGPLFTSVPLLEYFNSAETMYYIRNAAVFNARFHLPGVFDHNLLPGVVNGSLWTLPTESMMYLTLPFLAMSGILSRYAILPFAVSILVLAIAVGNLEGAIAAQSVMVASAVPLFSFLHFAAFFLFGSAFYIHRDRVPLSGGLAFVSLVVILTAPHTQERAWIDIPAFAYLVLYLGLAWPCTGWLDKRIGDLSYGTYLWAFPVQQSICAIVGPSIGTWTLSALATPIVLVIAFTSWHLVEKPSLALKSRFGSPDRHPEIVATDRQAA